MSHFLFKSLLMVSMMVHSMAQMTTLSSPDSSHDVPSNTGTSDAEQGPIGHPNWRHHFNPVNNIQIEGCCDTSASDNMVNLTRTILEFFKNQAPPCNPAPVAVAQRPRDCAEVQASGVTTSGVYGIFPDGSGSPFFVYCDMGTDGGGWTVFQRRQDGTVNFFLEWTDYKYGFGSVSSEHWLGNDNIHRLSTQKTYELRVDLEDFTGQTRYASYSSFYVADEAADYVMTLGGYSGNAGDSLTYHSGHPFTTKDRDNDNYGTNCAVSFTGAWWYSTCHNSNLNGRYLHGSNQESGKGAVWNGWLSEDYSLKKTEMKIRPV